MRSRDERWRTCYGIVNKIHDVTLVVSRPGRVVQTPFRHRPRSPISRMHGSSMLIGASTHWMQRQHLVSPLPPPLFIRVRRNLGRLDLAAAAPEDIGVTHRHADAREVLVDRLLVRE